MRINTYTAWQMMPDGGFELLERVSYEYNGPVARAFGGDSETSSEETTITETTQEIDTTTIGIEDANFAIGAGRDVTLTDPGLVAFGGEALETVENVSERAFEFGSQESDRAMAASQAALGTLGQAITQVSDASRSDTTDTFRRIAIPAIIGISLVFVVIAFRGK